MANIISGPSVLAEQRSYLSLLVFVRKIDLFGFVSVPRPRSRRACTGPLDPPRPLLTCWNLHLRQCYQGCFRIWYQSLMGPWGTSSRRFPMTDYDEIHIPFYSPVPPVYLALSLLNSTRVRITHWAVHGYMI